MKATTSFKRVLTVASLALAGLSLTSAVQAAQLTYDLRVVGSTAPATNFSNPHQVAASTPGEVLTINLYALIQTGSQVPGDTNFANDGFLGGQGSLHKTGTLTGAFRGDAAGQAQSSTVNNTPGFTLANVSGSGVISALDPDGLFDDIGSNGTGSVPSLNPFFDATSEAGSGSLPQTGTGTGTGFAEFLIGQFQFTISASAQSGQSFSLVFAPRVRVGGTATNKQLDFYRVDGVDMITNGDSPNIAEIGLTVLIPEPSAIGMLLLGSVGLVGFRRSAFRHLVG